MRRGDRKTTKEEVEKMCRLYQEGLNCETIGRIMGRNHTTVLWWLRKKGIARRKPQDYLKEIRKSYLNFVKEKIQEERESELSELKKKILDEKLDEKPKEVLKNICLYCKKEKKDSKWTKTNFCSLRCWNSYYEEMKSKIKLTFNCL